MVGKKYEAGGIAKDGAKMVTGRVVRAGAEVHASSSAAATAPATTACAAARSIRASCGCGRTRASRVMGGEQAATRARDGPPRRDRGEGRHVERRRGGGRSRRRSATQYEREGHPYYASARLWDDGVIDPADTRRVLAPRRFPPRSTGRSRRRDSAYSGCRSAWPEKAPRPKRSRRTRASESFGTIEVAERNDDRARRR